ncbi:hypothetical protein B0H19DRAFT_1098564 [Mycena capillaripes]|nr:hypothetical protein B0H19DRAFT_1098564 [Mycena capillaripes]
MNTQTALTIYSLPNELLAAIAAAGQEGRLRGAFKPEWTLSHCVSRRFRDVIVRAPALWTIIQVNLAAEGSVEIFKLYVERAGACELWADIKSSPHEPDRLWADDLDRNLIAERLAQIVPHVNRMWRLSIRVLSEWEHLMLAPFRNIAAPVLQHLEIVKPPEGTRSDPFEIFSSGAPRLTFLKMRGLKLQLPTPQWTASLTHLELWGGLGSDGYDLLVAITAQCPLLVDLYLDIRWTSRPSRRFHIPFLKSLHISIYDALDQHYMLSILDLFDTPALVEFKIDDVHGDQVAVLFNSTSLPHASFPALTSLCLINRNLCACEDVDSFSPTSTSPPLMLFPALSSLTLINLCFMRGLVDDILGPVSQPWPSLQTFALHPMEVDVGDVRHALRSAIRSKRERGQPLPKFRLSSVLFSDETWQENGVTVEIFELATFG